MDIGKKVQTKFIDIPKKDRTNFIKTKEFKEFLKQL